MNFKFTGIFGLLLCPEPLDPLDNEKTMEYLSEYDKYYSHA